MSSTPILPSPAPEVPTEHSRKRHLMWIVVGALAALAVVLAGMAVLMGGRSSLGSADELVAAAKDKGLCARLQKATDTADGVSEWDCMLASGDFTGVEVGFVEYSSPEFAESAVGLLESFGVVMVPVEGSDTLFLRVENMIQSDYVMFVLTGERAEGNMQG